MKAPLNATPVAVDAVTTTIHFTSYDIRSGDKDESWFFPVCGTLSITEIKDTFAEDQHSKLHLECDGLTVYTNGKRYWLTQGSAILDDLREFRIWDHKNMEYATIATVPQFTDPYDAFVKMESLLHELSKKKDTPDDNHAEPHIRK